MILDTHMHTAEYSPDSFLPIAEAVARAREMGIGGLCVTDHDTLGALDLAENAGEAQAALFASLRSRRFHNDGVDQHVAFALKAARPPSWTRRPAARRYRRRRRLS